MNVAEVKTGNTLSHPLLGSTLPALVRILRAYGTPDGAGWRTLAAAFGSALGRSPFTFAEWCWTRSTNLWDSDFPPPIIIVGHWRSGTTHLYNILGTSPQFAYVSPVATGLPADFLLLGRLIRPLLERALPSGRVIDNIPVTPTSPQEDEIALASLSEQSFMHALYFPKHFNAIIDRHLFFEGVSPAEEKRWSRTFLGFLEKVQRTRRGCPVILKNPVYTARIALLRQIVPQARFIHLHRHPDEVFRSMRGYYHKLLPELALQRACIDDLDGRILGIYARMMERLDRDARDLPANQWVECRYEDLQADPMGLLQHIFNTLELDGFDDSAPHFQNYLDSLKDYQRNPHHLSEADQQLVRSRLARVFERWNYPLNPANDASPQPSS
ncbi:MAG: sulfotransferase [Opitutales bacterium]